CAALVGQPPRYLTVGGDRPPLAGTDRAWRKRDHRPVVGQAATRAPLRYLGGRDLELGQRPVGRLRRARRQYQHPALVDHAGQLLLAPAQVVEQTEAELADEASPLRDAGEERRERGLPGPQHDQRRAVALGPQPVGERLVLTQRQPTARQVAYDALADAG